eukprot:TRINITY_DN31077_c0_g1_i1.p1 TRINITY_DN31077_c0_g1~~TRINITY_DN31077_c0_g1_i1.p1  ORF type:complete len:543 (-),score=128.71 TRINITY_DN31077_c0_g1_i1:690-2216(-)
MAPGGLDEKLTAGEPVPARDVNTNVPKKSLPVRVRGRLSACFHDMAFLHRPIGLHGWFTITLLELIVLAALVGSIMAQTTEKHAYSVVNMMLLIYLMVPHNSIVTAIFGITWEVLIQYHRWFAYLLFIPITWHGYDHFVYRHNNDIQHKTGNAMYTIYLLMIVTSLPIVRRWSFEAFYWPHVPLAITFATLSLIHNRVVIVRLWWVMLLVVVDWAIRMRLNFKPARVIDVRTAPGCPAIELTVAFEGAYARKRWRHTPGQFAFVYLPGVHRLEWHPVTISSAPSHTYQTGQITFHIKNMGDGTWTEGIHKRIVDGSIVRLDGPYGAISIAYERSDQLLLVAGGIGVTPMMSVLGDVMAKAEASEDVGWYMKTQRVHLVWVIRQWQLVLLFQEQLERLITLKAKYDGNEGKGGCAFDFSLHVTGAGLVQEAAEGLPDSVRPYVKHGRPEWRPLMQQEAELELLQRHGRYKRMAVLICGPAALTGAASSAAYKAARRGVTVQVHEHTFEI